MPRARNVRKKKGHKPEFTAGGLPGFMSDLALNAAELAVPATNLTLKALQPKSREAFTKGTATAPLTFAPDTVGMLAQYTHPASYAGPGTPALVEQMRQQGLEFSPLEQPPISGDPIRELAGLDPADPFGIAGEFADPTVAFGKLFKAATVAIKSGKGMEVLAAGLSPLAAFFKKQAAKPTIKLADTSIVSTRRPTAVASKESPDENYLQIDLEAMQADPKTFNKNVKLVTQYPNYQPKAGVTAPNARAESLIEDMKGNLLWLHSQVDPAIAKRSALWYDGGAEIIGRLEQSYPGLSHQQYAGVIASLSPQMDWFTNVSLAERVISTKMMFGGHKFDDGMAAVAERLGSEDKLTNEARKVVSNIVGRRLDDLDNSLEKAWFIRLFDEAHNPREYAVVSPEGANIGPAVLKDGETLASASWGSAGPIRKAVQIIEDGSIENISKALGNQHKVRSFNNNIADPDNVFGDVTIDTHAVAAALLRPLSGKSSEVIHALGGASSSSVVGTKGTYALYAEAYRRAAAELGLLPRQMQSITWEAVRGLFPAAQKTHMLQESDRIWGLYRKKEISIDEAREAINSIAGGINPPAWHVSDVGLHARKQNVPDAGELPESGVLQQGSGTGAARGTRITPDVQEAGLPGRKAVEIGSLRANVDRHVTAGQPPAFRRGTGGNSQRNLASFELRPDHVERLKTIKADAPPVREMTGMEGARLFHAAVKQAKKTNKYGAQVSLKETDKYANMRLFMTNDGKAGFALDGDDIVSLFNHGESPYSGIATSMVMLAVEQGGRRLDNYDTFLPHIYKRLGFEETKRFPWNEAERADDWDEQVYRQFNKGRPDYLYMEYRPTGSLTDRLVEGGQLGEPEEVLSKLPGDMLQGVDLKRFDDRLKQSVMPELSFEQMAEIAAVGVKDDPAQLAQLTKLLGSK